MNLLIPDLLDLKQTEHALLFRDCKYPWEVLPKIGKYLEKHLKHRTFGTISPSAVIEGPVFIGGGAIIGPNVYIKGPAWIGKDCEVRQGAFLRGNVIIGDRCIVGNSCEFKNAVLFNEVQVPHFAYVGDSILGFRSHLASGVTLSNLKVTKGNIVLLHEGKKIDTKLRKFGAIIGDYAEAGCHSVLNPGSIIGRNSTLYAGVSWRGICPPNKIVKLKQDLSVVDKEKK
jgi:UDP-N-acetylglucosamine diphosphorylase / glucose-1-phosphate thymidylyltransferase / UDP-N-acetylgalactosamine diphosphorylase / glucosamine-1-phosphate N-acetyltransferase / galactosamine-1-phosphate N-acetyltransferase